MSLDQDALAGTFENLFPNPPSVVSEAPGRVNLIGEHTDHNGGFVLPVAIDRSAMVLARQAEHNLVHVDHIEVQECDSISLDDVKRTPVAAWHNYIRGVAWALQAAGYRLSPADLLVAGNVPQGVGLSSSAALELAVAGALCAVAGISAEPRELALLCQKAENEFVGVQCGIMDQFASALGRAGHALLIDCRSLEVEHVPLALEEHGVSIVVVDSKLPRRLVDTPYNRRREECFEAAQALGLESLRDADETALETLREPLRRRARHVVSENGRVLEAVGALREGNIGRFGGLMYSSHESLRDDFEVSCRELDLLVELASRTEGVLGARLTGAGFGGCTVNLVIGKTIGRFREQVVERYRTETGLPAGMHVCRAVDGLKVTHV